MTLWHLPGRLALTEESPLRDAYVTALLPVVITLLEFVSFDYPGANGGR